MSGTTPTQDLWERELNLYERVLSYLDDEPVMPTWIEECLADDGYPISGGTVSTYLKKAQAGGAAERVPEGWREPQDGLCESAFVSRLHSSWPSGMVDALPAGNQPS